jgi:hypothetical protein
LPCGGLGLRVVCFARCWLIAVLAFPCFVSGLLASPLCGAALTFFAAAKKVSKESGLTPPARSETPRTLTRSGPNTRPALAHSPFRDKALIHPVRALRARRPGITARGSLVARGGQCLAGAEGVNVPDGGARSATLERMSAVSQERSVRMRISCRTTTGYEQGWTLMGWRGEPAFFAYFLCGGKESECRPAQGRRE